MSTRFTKLALLGALACVCFAGLAVAQDSHYAVSVPRFVVLPPHPATVVASPAVSLPLWNGSFTYKAHKYPFQMVGKDPSVSNATTTVKSYIIPIKMVFDKTHGNKTFNPNTAKFAGTSVSVTATIKTSPIFRSGVDFTQGGTDLGTTQYIDAFQRGSFWTSVKTHTNYHTKLSTPTVLPIQTFNCNFSGCAVGFEFGKKVGLADINAFDNFLQPLFSKLGITADTFPIFLTYDVYLTSGGCCIGGYHSVGGGGVANQTYAHTTTIDQGGGVFSQDTAALSHEVGEWIEDPLINGGNNTVCGILEVGDPLVLHDFAYSLHSFTYHLQDLVWMPYWGAPTSTSANGWYSFQNGKHGVCQ